MAENKNRLRVPAPVVQKEETEPKKKTKGKEDKQKKPKKPESKIGKRRKESDGKFRICSGIFFFLISVFLLIAFASPYMGYSTKGLWLNNLGKFMSEDMFGIGTAYIVFLIGLLGISLILKRVIIKSWTLWKYSLVFLLWLPLLLALVLNNAVPQTDITSVDIYFGVVGHKCYVFLMKYIGIHRNSRRDTASALHRLHLCHLHI